MKQDKHHTNDDLAKASPGSNGAAKELEDLRLMIMKHDQSFASLDEIMATLEHLIEQSNTEARRQAIKSYKKVNKFHEAEIRIDELLNIQNYLVSNEWQNTYILNYFDHRLTQLKALSTDTEEKT